MAAFLGAERKLTILIMAVYMFGWLVFLIGFIVVLAVQTGVSAPLPLEGVNLIPWIVSAVGGPMLFVMTLCYAGTSDLISSLLGFFTAYLRALVTASLSSTLYEAYFYVAYPLYSTQVSMIVAFALVIIGAAICIHCLCIALVFSTLYKDHDTNSVTEKPHTHLFQGYARKLAIIPSVLMLIGWILMMAAKPIWDPNWYYGISQFIVGIFLFGVPAIALILAHAGTWGVASRTLGFVTAYAITIYLFFTGVFLHSAIISLSDEDYSIAPSIRILIGTLFSCLSVAMVLSLWPFYHRTGSWTLKTRPTQSGTRQDGPATVVNESDDERLLDVTQDASQHEETTSTQSGMQQDGPATVFNESDDEGLLDVTQDPNQHEETTSTQSGMQQDGPATVVNESDDEGLLDVTQDPSQHEETTSTQSGMQQDGPAAGNQSDDNSEERCITWDCPCC